MFAGACILCGKEFCWLKLRRAACVFAFRLFHSLVDISSWSDPHARFSENSDKLFSSEKQVTQLDQQTCTASI